MNSTKSSFTAVILAGARSSHDPVASAAGVPCKSLAPIGNRPMVMRVIDALGASDEVQTRILCGPPPSAIEQCSDLQARIASGDVQWQSNRSTPSASTFQVLNSLPGHLPVLVTTADHALLSSRVIDYFCRAARQKRADIVVGLARYDQIARVYPNVRRTVTRLKDGGYCSCNLFAFLTPSSHALADFWRKYENQRKSPVRLIRAIGWAAILKYLFGWLSLKEALARLSEYTGLEIGVVLLPFAEAAIDVDSLEDVALVETILKQQPS